MRLLFRVSALRLSYVISRLLAVLVVSAACGAIGILSGCSVNAFSEFALKDADDAIYFDATQLMNKKDWTGAIAKFQKLSTDYLALREVKAAYASAYAGRCGLNIIDLADKIANTSNSTFEKILLTAFTGATTSNIADCVQAETLIEEISTAPTSRTSDENLLAAFTGFAKIAAVLATYADTDKDGTPDVAFDPCNTAMLPDADARKMGTGLTKAYNALNTSSLSSIASATASLTAFCNTAALSGTCSKTTESAFTAAEVKALNGITKTNFFGVGSCSDTLLASCVCL